MRHELHSEIEIDASPEAVWSVLADPGAYGDWNPFITSATGALAVGQRLAVRLEPPGGRAVRLRPTLTAVEAGRVLAWLGRIGVPGLFDARHRFALIPVAGGTRFVQSERFSGLLVRWMRRSLDGATRAGFEAMNVALKQRVLHATTV